MSERVKRYLPTLKRIRRMSEKHRRVYVWQCVRQFIDCISECLKMFYMEMSRFIWKCPAHISSEG